MLFNNDNNLYQENNIYNIENQLYSNNNPQKINNSSENQNNQQIDYSSNYSNITNKNQKNSVEESLKIMEKDKIIFEYMKKEKELNKIISNLNKELSSKNEQNYFLGEQIRQFKINNNDNIINRENIALKLNEEKNKLINEITRLNFIIHNHEDSMKKAIETINEKNENINNLQNELIQKNNIIKKNDEIKSNIRKENKQIPSLKSKINDFEQVIKVYQEKINELQKNNEIISTQNQLLKKGKNQKKIEIPEKSKNFGKTGQNFEDKNAEYSKLYEKFIRLKNDSDAFIRGFLNELGNMVNFIEMIKIGNNDGKIFQIQEFDELLSQDIEKIKLNEGFALKYEIMDSSLKQAKEKIINLVNKGNNYWNKINNERLNSINENEKEFKNEKDILNQKINMSNLEIKKYQNLIEELNKDYENIKNNYIKLKQNYTDFSSKNDFLENNFNNFINQIENKLKDFPFEINKNEVNDDEILNPTQKIIMQITSLINFCKELNNRLKEAKRCNKEINIKNNKEKQQLNNKINDLNNLIKEKEEIINKCKSNEENLVKINMQLQKTLFIKKKKNEYKNGEDNMLIDNQEKYEVPEYIYDNDQEREIKLQNILDNYNIKEKINSYCNDFQ